MERVEDQEHESNNDRRIKRRKLPVACEVHEGGDRDVISKGFEDCRRVANEDQCKNRAKRGGGEDAPFAINKDDGGDDDQQSQQQEDAKALPAEERRGDA